MKSIVSIILASTIVTSAYGQQQFFPARTQQLNRPVFVQQPRQQFVQQQPVSGQNWRAYGQRPVQVQGTWGQRQPMPVRQFSGQPVYRPQAPQRAFYPTGYPNSYPRTQSQFGFPTRSAQPVQRPVPTQQVFRGTPNPYFVSPQQPTVTVAPQPLVTPMPTVTAHPRTITNTFVQGQSSVVNQNGIQRIPNTFVQTPTATSTPTFQLETELPPAQPTEVVKEIIIEAVFDDVNEEETETQTEEHFATEENFPADEDFPGDDQEFTEEQINEFFAEDSPHEISSDEDTPQSIESEQSLSLIHI